VSGEECERAANCSTRRSPQTAKRNKKGNERRRGILLSAGNERITKLSQEMPLEEWFSSFLYGEGSDFSDRFGQYAIGHGPFIRLDASALKQNEILTTDGHFSPL